MAPRTPLSLHGESSPGTSVCPEGILVGDSSGVHWLRHRLSSFPQAHPFSLLCASHGSPLPQQQLGAVQTSKLYPSVPEHFVFWETVGFSSPPHLLGVPGSLPKKMARGTGVIFSVLETGRIFPAMGRHGNHQMKSPNCELRSEILVLDLVWEQDPAAAVLLAGPKPLCGCFSALSAWKLCIYHSAGKECSDVSLWLKCLFYSTSPSLRTFTKYNLLQQHSLEFIERRQNTALIRHFFSQDLHK